MVGFVLCLLEAVRTLSQQSALNEMQPPQVQQFLHYVELYKFVRLLTRSMNAGSLTLAVLRLCR